MHAFIHPGSPLHCFYVEAQRGGDRIHRLSIEPWTLAKTKTT